MKTGKKIIASGIPIFTPNDVYRYGENWYVSYNNRDTAIYGSDTTALVLEQPTKFLILNSNHIAQYAEIFASGGDYYDCMAYFVAHHCQQSKHSDNWDELLEHVNGKLINVKDMHSIEVMQSKRGFK